MEKIFSSSVLFIYKIIPYSSIFYFPEYHDDKKYYLLLNDHCFQIFYYIKKLISKLLK